MAFKNKSQTVPPQTSWFTTMSFSEHFFFENNRPLWSTRTVIPTSAVHVRIFLYGQAGQEAQVLKIQFVQEISGKKTKYIYMYYPRNIFESGSFCKSIRIWHEAAIFQGIPIARKGYHRHGTGTINDRSATPKMF